MRILLDECLPRELATELGGHEAITVQQAGWKGLENGELLRKAAGSFHVFLTVDKQLGRQVAIPADLAVIPIRARSNRIQDLRPLVPALLQTLKQANPGKSIAVLPRSRR
ncbi:MAG: DUF5615 family PIN-like protein [Terriglobia bacterium]